jgi:hypothetical protein
VAGGPVAGDRLRAGGSGVGGRRSPGHADRHVDRPMMGVGTQRAGPVVPAGERRPRSHRQPSGQSTTATRWAIERGLLVDPLNETLHGKAVTVTARTDQATLTFARTAATSATPTIPDTLPHLRGRPQPHNPYRTAAGRRVQPPDTGPAVSTIAAHYGDRPDNEPRGATGRLVPGQLFQSLHSCIMMPGPSRPSDSHAHRQRRAQVPAPTKQPDGPTGRGRTWATLMPTIRNSVRGERASAQMACRSKTDLRRVVPDWDLSVKGPPPPAPGPSARPLRGRP